MALKRAILGGKDPSPNYAHLDVPEGKRGRGSPRCPSSHALMSGLGWFGDKGFGTHTAHAHTRVAGKKWGLGRFWVGVGPHSRWSRLANR